MLNLATEIPRRSAKTEQVAEFFRDRPLEWIDALDLAKVGGRLASRTRISDCRKQLGMTIENRLSRVDENVISEYRFVPSC